MADAAAATEPATGADAADDQIEACAGNANAKDTYGYPLVICYIAKPWPIYS